MTHRSLSAALFSAIVALGSAAQAQAVSDVTFEPGNYGAMVSGTVIGDEYIDYRLGAQAGQEMFAELAVTDSNGSGTVYFNILPPGSDGVAIHIGSMDGNTATVELPETGDYVIRVYHMGADEDEGKTSGFEIDLSIQ